jgi:transposase-like protein
MTSSGGRREKFRFGADVLGMVLLIHFAYQSNNVRTSTQERPIGPVQWHLDEVFLKINGRLHYLWRAVDQDGDVLDILVQSRRD